MPEESSAPEEFPLADVDTSAHAADAQSSPNSALETANNLATEVAGVSTPAPSPVRQRSREPVPLETASDLPPVTSAADRRLRIPEPLPVRLVAVSDCEVAAAAGLEVELDAFYIGLLGFEKMDDPHSLQYRAENYRLSFIVTELAPVREDFRPVGILVPSLPTLRAQLDEREIEYLRQKSLVPGVESLLLTDPAGNWLEISEMRIAI